MIKRLKSIGNLSPFPWAWVEPKYRICMAARQPLFIPGTIKRENNIDKYRHTDKIKWFILNLVEFINHILLEFLSGTDIKLA